MVLSHKLRKTQKVEHKIKTTEKLQWEHSEGAEIGMLQIQVLCPCCVLATPAHLQGGKVRITLAPFNTFSDKAGKNACFSNLFVLCEEMALP